MIKKKIDEKELEKRIKERNWIEDKELLKLVIDDYKGKTVAHLQAAYGWRTEDKEILKLADKDGWTVAHQQVFNGGWTTEDKEILKLADNWGLTVAHMQAARAWTTEDKEILKLTTNWGWTVAHEQAKESWRTGWRTEDKEILKLADNKGWTVAHIQAKHGWITADEEILKLETYHPRLKVYLIITHFWEFKSYEENLNEVKKNFSKLHSFVLKMKELDSSFITTTQLYRVVMELAEKKMFVQNVLKQNVSKQLKRNNLNK